MRSAVPAIKMIFFVKNSWPPEKLTINDKATKKF